MVKSFKDIYEEDKKAPLKETTTDAPVEITNTPNTTTVTVDPEAGAVVLDRPSPTMTVLDGVTEEAAPVAITEDIKDVLTEQREQSAKVLESVMKTNTKIANNVTKLVKGSTETNEKLVEAITALTDKIELLEAKLEAIEKLEIPTPVVHVQMPNTKVHKEIHRDEKTGMISHITESEIADDEDE